jgi:predicted site-specific integrase-resolvase
MPPIPATQVAPFPIDPVLAIPEAAKIAGVSLWTLKRRASDGELTIIKLSTRRIGIRMSELYRWMDTREARA